MIFLSFFNLQMFYILPMALLNQVSRELYLFVKINCINDLLATVSEKFFMKYRYWYKKEQSNLIDFFPLLHRRFSLLPQRLGKGQRQLLSPKWRIKVLKGERGDHYPL